MFGMGKIPKAKNEADNLTETHVSDTNTDFHSNFIPEQSSYTPPPSMSSTYGNMDFDSNFQRPADHSFYNPDYYVPPTTPVTNTFPSYSPPRTNLTIGIFGPGRFFNNDPYGDNDPLFYGSQSNRTADAVDNLHRTIHRDNARRRRDEEQARREAKERDLNETRPPRDGEIRRWVRNALNQGHTRSLPDHPDKFLSFTNAHKPLYWQNNNTEFEHFPATALEFWNGINECTSEAQTRRYIKFVRDSLESMIRYSDLSEKDKERFIDTLYVENPKQASRVFAAIVGLIVFVALFPVCMALATSGLALQCAATSLLCIGLSFGPYWFVEKTTPDNRSFPDNRGPVCEVTPFKKWIKEMANVACAIDPDAANGNIPVGVPYDAHAASAPPPSYNPGYVPT